MADAAVPLATVPLPTMPLAAVPLAAVSLEAVLFAAFAALAVGSAVLAVAAPRIVHAAFGLLGAFAGVAGLYALLGADFVALAQVLIYVGGILVLLVFGVLLTQGRMGGEGAAAAAPRLAPVLVGGLLLVGLLGAIHATDFGVAWPASAEGAATAEPPPTTGEIGRALLEPGVEEGRGPAYLVPFELASVLLLAALIGAAYLVRRRRSA